MFEEMSYSSKERRFSLPEYQLPLAKGAIYQDNGQVIYTASDDVSYTPPRGTEIFVSHLPTYLKITQLLPIVERCGAVHTLRLMMDFGGTNRGFAYVRYQTKEAAHRALSELNGLPILPGQRLKVAVSSDNCRLFIGQIRKTLKKYEIQAVLEEETVGLKDVILYLSSTDKTLNRGFCFVEYESHRCAAMARRKLITLDQVMAWAPANASIKVAWAIPEAQVDEDVMSKVAVLYVRNMMLRTTEASLREALIDVVPPGEVRRIRKVQDFAFIHFKHRSSAEQALKYLHGKVVDGAALDVTWAKPPPTGGPTGSSQPDPPKSGMWKKKSTFDLDLMARELPRTPPPAKPLPRPIGYGRPLPERTVPPAAVTMGTPAVTTGTPAVTTAGTQKREVITSAEMILPVSPQFFSSVLAHHSALSNKKKVQIIISHFRPSSALIYIADYMNWGNVEFNCIVYETIPPLFSSQVCLTDDNGVSIQSAPMYSQESPVGANDQAALDLLTKYVLPLFP